MIEAHGAFCAELQIGGGERELVESHLLPADAEVAVRVLEPQVGQLFDVQHLADGLEKFELLELPVAELEIPAALRAFRAPHVAAQFEFATRGAAGLAGLEAELDGEQVEIHLLESERRLERRFRGLGLRAVAALHRPARERGGEFGQGQFTGGVFERRAHIFQH